MIPPTAIQPPDPQLQKSPQVMTPPPLLPGPRPCSPPDVWQTLISSDALRLITALRSGTASTSQMLAISGVAMEPDERAGSAPLRRGGGDVVRRTEVIQPRREGPEDGQLGAADSTESSSCGKWKTPFSFSYKGQSVFFPPPQMMQKRHPSFHS